MKKLLIFIFLNFLTLGWILTKSNQPDFKDILDFSHTPKGINDKTIKVFADLGSWVGYGLSSQDQIKSGFTGPYLATSTEFISSCFAEFYIKPDKCNHSIKNQQFTYKENSFYPGLFQQHLIYKDFFIIQELVFKDSQTVVIRLKIKNRGTKNLSFFYGWQSIFFKGYPLKIKANLILAKREHYPFIYQLSFPREFTLQVNKDQNQYQAESKKITLKHGEELYTFFTAVFSEKILHPNMDFNQVFKISSQRWEQLQESIIKQLSSTYTSPKYRQLAIKALITLIINWKSPLGDLKHEGLFPSMHVTYFNGFWAWDSWKHAVALTKFNPELAKNQIKAMFDYQDQYGMIADCIYLDKRENNWRDTKPPLAGWAIYKVYQNTQDLGFLKYIYPKLLKYHLWWYQYRDLDRDGLCEYGSTDGSRIAAAWESGMDNAVRFDQAKILKYKNNAYSFNQESVDLNSFLFKEKIYLAMIAEILGDRNLKNQMSKDAIQLKKKILDLMYDKESNYFYDIEIASHKKIKIAGPEGFIPLWAKIPSFEQAQQIHRILKQEHMFNTHVPFPTLHQSHPLFNPEKGYWRGPVWLDGAYFAIKGLINYKLEDEAKYFINKLTKNAQGLLTKGFFIHENYHPISGKALNAPNFSWSAAHILLLLTE